MAGAAATGRDLGRSGFRWAAFAVVVLTFFLLCGELVLWAKGFNVAEPSGVLQAIVVGTHEFLGFSSALFTLILLLFWSGRAFLTGAMPRVGVKLLGIGGVILSVSGLAATVTYGQGEAAAQVGGWVGTTVAARMVPALGASFCMTLFCLLMVGSLMLATNWLFLEEFKGLASLKSGRPTEPVSFRHTDRATPPREGEAGAAGEAGEGYPLFQPDGVQAPAVAANRPGDQVTVAEESMLTGGEGAPEPRVVIPPPPAPPPKEETPGDPGPVEEPVARLEPEERSPAEGPEDSLTVGRTFHSLLAEVEDAAQDAAAAEKDAAAPAPVDPSALEGREHRFDEEEEEEPVQGQRLLWQERLEGPEEEGAPTPIPRIPPAPAPEKPAPTPSLDEPSVEIPRPAGAESPPATEGSEPVLLDEAARRIIASGRASLTLLQRSLKIGATQANVLMEELERRGLVGPYRGSLAREVLMSIEQWEEQGVGDRP